MSDMRLRGMRTGITFSLSSTDRQRLRDIATAPRSPQKHVWRARIILLSDEGLGTSAIMEATGKSKTCVWRWQERFMQEGVDGLLHDKTRPPGKAPIAAERVAEIVRLTQEAPPHEATHWTARLLFRPCRRFGKRMVLPHIAGAPLSCRMIRPLPRSSPIS